MRWSQAGSLGLTLWAIAACSSRVPIGEVDDAGPATTSGTGGASTGGGAAGTSITGGTAGVGGHAGSTVGTGGSGGDGGSTTGSGGAGGSTTGSGGVGGSTTGTGGNGGSTAGTGGAGGTDDAGGSAACPCTRRPGTGNSWQCPAGVGESTSMTIGPAGGKISLVAQQGKGSGVPFSLDIPPTALSQDTVVTITETSLAPPPDFIDYSPVYLVEPASLASSVRIRISLPSGNTSGMLASALSVYAAVQWGDPFERVADSYVNAGFMQASITQFGLFFAGSPKTPAQTNCP